MRQSTPLTLLSLVLQSYTASTQSVVSIGPNSVLCPSNPTVSLQPYYYSSYFAGPATIYNFNGNGDNITINNGDTTFITSGTITVTATATATATVTTTAGSSAVVSPILTSTSSPSSGLNATMTTNATSSTLSLGQGLPSGTVTSLPESSPLILAFAYDSPGNRVKRHIIDRPNDRLSLIKRQVAGGVSTGAAADISADGFAQSEGDDSTTGGGCGYATRFTLRAGSLRSMMTDDAVGLNATDTYALLSPWPFTNDITIGFYLVDGILHWDIPGRISAIFYQCGGGPLYAGFPNPPFNNCTAVLVGGIAGGACSVDLTGSNEPSTSPAAPSSTTMTTVTTSSVMSDSATSSDMSTATTVATTTSTSVPSTVSSASPTSTTSVSSTILTSSSSSPSSSTSPSSTSTSSSSSTSTSSFTNVSSSSSASTSSSASPTSTTSSTATSSGTTSTSQATSSPTTSISSLATTTSRTSTSSSVSTTSAITYCPQYNFTTAPVGDSTYEIYCDFKLVGQDIQPFHPTGYSSDNVTDVASCIGICNAWNKQQGQGYCIGVTYVGPKACYPYSSFSKQPVYSPQVGNIGARLIFAGYLSVTDAPGGTTATASLSLSASESASLSLSTSVSASLSLSASASASASASLSLSASATIGTTSQTTTSSSSSSSSLSTSSTSAITPSSVSTTTLASTSTAAPSSVSITLPTSGPCAGGKGPSSAYVALNGDTYGVCPGTDFLGTNIGTGVPESSLDACAEACSNTAGCIASDLTADTKFCYLKSNFTGSASSNNVDSVYRLSAFPGNSVTPTLTLSTTLTSGIISSTSLSMVIDTSSIIPTISTSSIVPTISTSSVIPTIDTSSIVPTISTSSIISTIDTSSIIPIISTSSVIPTIDTSSVIPTVSASSIIPTTISTSSTAPTVVSTSSTATVVVSTSSTVSTVVSTSSSGSVVISTSTASSVVTISTSTSVGGSVSATVSASVTASASASVSATITGSASVRVGPVLTLPNHEVTTISPCITAVMTNMPVATAPIAAGAYCPTYDMSIVADNSYQNNYQYQIYCDADIGGTDLGLPAGFTESITDMNGCIDACNYWNSDPTCLVCEAVVYLGGSGCYPKVKVYTQPALGQYNYYNPGHTAAQIMDQNYPKPTATKDLYGPNGPPQTTSTTTTM